MAKYKVVDVSAVRSFLEKVGVESSIPEEGRVSFIVRKKSDDEVVAIVRGKKKHVISIPMENYEEYLKFGRVGLNSRWRGPRGSKTLAVLRRISDILAEQGEVSLPAVWRVLHEEGLVSRRPELYQIAKKYCSFDYGVNNNRRVMIIKGVKRF